MDTFMTDVCKFVKASARAVVAAFLGGLLALPAFASPARSPAPARPEVKPAQIPIEKIQILPIEKITPGMKGYGVSDLGDGRGIQRFEVEVLGVLKRYAPRQDLILARVSGAGLETSGIIAGMSGSPIYIEDKLVGALAYGWPFSKDPICGITPIQSMLDIRHAPAAPPVPIGGSAAQTTALLASFAQGHFSERFAELLRPFNAPAGGDATPLPLPVSFGGAIGPGRLFERVAESAGWMAVPSGAAAPAAASPEATALRPGSAVAAQLLSGDMDLSATGTVTWVEGNALLAFGHPFLSMGPVSMPMARAEVLTVLPSVFRSFKFAATGPVLGSISQDRSTGILGSFGARAPMVPITVRISSDQVPLQTYHFQAVHNSMLTPILS